MIVVSIALGASINPVSVGLAGDAVLFVASQCLFELFVLLLEIGDIVSVAVSDSLAFRVGADVVRGFPLHAYQMNILAPEIGFAELVIQLSGCRDCCLNLHAGWRSAVNALHCFLSYGFTRSLPGFVVCLWVI